MGESGMRMAISMTHASRPKYTRQSVQSVLRARDALGAEGRAVPLFMHVEPGSIETHAICEAFARAGDQVVLNPLQKFVGRNTIAAIDHGFASGADFVVHCEDDTPLAPDALCYMRWAAERFADDWCMCRDSQHVSAPVCGVHLGHDAIATVAGYHREPEMPPSSRWSEVRSRNWFHPWAWGTWRSRWQELRRAIDVDHGPTWDIQVNTLMLSQDWCEVFPVLARSQNIGLYSSIHPGVFSPDWYREHHVLKHWAGSESVSAFLATRRGGWLYAGRDAGEDAHRVHEKAGILAEAAARAR